VSTLSKAEQKMKEFEEKQ
jgi:hypothetical protein